MIVPSSEHPLPLSLADRLLLRRLLLCRHTLDGLLRRCRGKLGNRNTGLHLGWIGLHERQRSISLGPGRLTRREGELTCFRSASCSATMAASSICTASSSSADILDCSVSSISCDSVDKQT